MPTWLCPPNGTVTTTSTDPAACAGTTTSSLFCESNVTWLAALPPNVTVAAAVKPLPLMVTVFPPPAGPALGLSPAIVGTSA